MVNQLIKSMKDDCSPRLSFLDIELSLHLTVPWGRRKEMHKKAKVTGGQGTEDAVWREDPGGKLGDLVKSQVRTAEGKLRYT